jgi:hypothetical protein
MAIIGIGATGFFYPQSAVVNYGHEKNVYALLRSIPQTDIPAHGITLVVTDGIESFTLTDCAVDKGSMVFGEDGMILSVGLIGAVWRWNGEISGGYNVRKPDGTIVESTKKTCQQLAALLWQSMDVTVGDVSALPGDDSDLPEVLWQCNDSYAELARLCRDRGCVPQLNATNNSGQVVRLGVGPVLPANADLQTVANSFGATPPPRLLKACAGSTRFQSKLKLKMMMLEPDGTLVDADEVSYKPEGGWVGVDPQDPLDADADAGDRAAAKKSYGKYWQVESQADGSTNVPGYGPAEMERILPLLDETAEDFDAGIGSYRRRAYLKGKVVIAGANDSLENSDDDELIEVEFRLIGELGIVISPVPLTKLDDDQQHVPADVYLVCSYHVQDTTTLGYVHHSVERTIAPAGGGTRALRLPHVEKRVIAEYDGTAVTGTTTNEGTVNAVLNGALDAAQSQYQVVVGSVARYRGIQPAPLSGTIRQIRIVCDMDGGCMTWLSYNTEWAPGMPRLRQRKRAAITDRVEAMQEFQDRQRRQLVRKGVV